MKIKSLLLTPFVSLCLTTATLAQTCWQQVSTITDMYLRIVKANDSTFFAASGNTSLVGPPSAYSLYSSTDLNVWSPLNVNLPSFAGLAFNIDNNQNLFLATYNSGVYTSTNLGSTWSYSNVGNGFGCMALDFEKDTANNLFASIGGFLRGLHVSNDNGLSWVNKIPGIDFGDIETVNALNQVYACSGVIYFSNDNGGSWNQIVGQPFSNNAIMVKHFNTDIFVFTSLGEIFKSSNAGSSWSLYSQIPITGTGTIYGNDLVKTNSGDWWINIQPNGVWRSNDNGVSWNPQDSCITGIVNYLFNEGSTILATTSTGIFKYELGISCNNNTNITPQSNSLMMGNTATFAASTTDPNPSYVWQSDLGQGFQTLNNFGNYSGTNAANLNIANVQLANHNQPIRVISTSGNCIDTSNVAVINILDTCLVTVYDTLLTTVTDTLVINAQITGINPPNNLNTLKVFPNPASTHITIDYGNFNAMSGYTLTIVNSIGQTVFTTPINQQTSYIDLSTWTGNGIYFVQLIDPQNNTIENRKIVIQ
jgi:hypothetical protein